MSHPQTSAGGAARKRRLLLGLAAALVGSVTLWGCGRSPSSATGAGATGEGDGIAWITSYPAGVAKARAAGKPILVQFHATWCPPCAMMERETFPDDAVRTLVSERFVPVTIDVDQDLATPQRFEVRSIPTTVVVKADGTVVDSNVGMLGPREFIEWAKRAAQKEGS